MRKTKLVIAFLILFISVGIAAVTTSVLISGSTQLASNPSDFLVYFSNVLVNGEQDLSLVQSKNSLYFSNVLNEVGDSYVISYDVTNASKNYDADISISCTQGNEYISVVNEFDSTSYLTATSTRSGVLTISLKKTYAGEYELVHDVSCIIDSEAVERTSQSGGSVPTPLSKYSIGKEISIGDEKFNIISETQDTVTMFSQYNLGTNYRQSLVQNSVKFADTNGWEYKPGPKEIDIQTWSTNPKTYVNAYVEYLKEELGDDNVTGDLITLKDLEELGCTVPSDYAWGSGGWDCYDSPYGWIVNGQDWWTRSANSSLSNCVWTVSIDGSLYDYFKAVSSHGVRPVITIDKTVVDGLLEKNDYRTYEIGEVITIDTESFNVISDNGDTVTMFAKEVLSTDYLQCVDEFSGGEAVNFSYETGWEYTPGPKEINIRDYSSEVATYLDNYQANLRTMTGDDALTTDLITLTQLGELGCIISEDYTPTGEEECSSSSYADWLIISRWIWTKSARSNDSEMVWVMDTDGYLALDANGEWFSGDYYYGNAIHDSNGVRPVVTISKEYLPE